MLYSPPQYLTTTNAFRIIFVIYTHIRHTYIHIYKRVRQQCWLQSLSVHSTLIRKNQYKPTPFYFSFNFSVFIIFIYFLKCIYLHPYIKFVTILTVSVKTFLFTSICKESLSLPPNQSTNTDSYTLILRIAVNICSLSYLKSNF